MGNPEAEPINQQKHPSENFSPAPSSAPPAYSEISSAPMIPPQPAFAPGHSQETPTAPTIPVIQAQPQVTVNPYFGNKATFCTCPHCQYEVNENSQSVHQ